MKKLVNAFIGEENAAKPAKRYTIYMIFVTLAVLVLTVLTLIVSSIVFAVADGNQPPASDDRDGGEEGGSGISLTISYTTASVADLEENLDDSVNIRDNRSSLSGGVYYATKDTSMKLYASAQKALDAMLVAFYNANKTSLVADSGDDNCNIPLIGNTDSKTVLSLLSFNEENTAGVALYSWIYANAHKYGFVYKDNSFTYVGAAVATYMKNKSLSDYESFINTLKGTSTSTFSITAQDEVAGKTSTYQIYYLSKDGEIKIPSNYKYTVSSVSDGYVITVDTSSKTTN